MKTLKNIVIFTAAFALATAVNVHAGATASPILEVLSEATAVELPVKAAQLVTQTDAKHLKQTTIDVVRAAVGLNPAAAAAIVGSIAKASPEMAATAASTAVSLVPNQAVAIARAAASAAPEKAGQIVDASCRALATAYQEIAGTVAEVVPGMDKEILTAVSMAIPPLKIPIAQVLTEHNGNIPSVRLVLKQAAAKAQAATTTSLTPSTLDTPSPSLSPVTVGPPYVPPATPHVYVDPNSGGEVPTGGRNYAAP